MPDDEPDGFEACQRLALRYGTLVGLANATPADDRHARFEPQRRHRCHARTDDGFDLDARVHIEQGDDRGRERLVRYCARPAIVLERLERLPDGRYSYRTKYTRNGRTHRVMTGTELLARIAALVPPPRYPLVRYHGCFALTSRCRLPPPATRPSTSSHEPRPALTSGPQQRPPVPQLRPSARRDEAEDEAYRAAFEVLKPGGIFCVVQHRAAEEETATPQERAASGYVKQSYVVEVAGRAGFVLDEASEINANPRDTRDHPEGVWTLPPALRLGDVDRERYQEIGESDRMTLRFRKPE